MRPSVTNAVLPPSRFHLGAPAAQPRGLFSLEDFARLRAHVESNPALGDTPLRKDKPLAKELALKQLLLKDETDRFSLPAFKGLGAGFAIAELRARGALGADATLVCASEGNHGRAVARAARTHGLRTRVYLGERVAGSRVEAIALEGAEVVRVAGTYDDAVRAAASDAEQQGWTVISDTGYPGYEEIPRLIMLGYTRLMDEAAAQWKSKAPDLVLVQGGVGGLAAAVASWYARHRTVPRPRLVCVEPLAAACLMESAIAGRAVSIPGPHDTIMGGLRCGEASLAALPAVLEGFDAYLAVDDGWTRLAMRRLARPSPERRAVAAGASGAAALGALLALRDDPALAPLRATLAIGADTRAMVIITEGVTEPELYEEVVGGGAGTRPR